MDRKTLMIGGGALAVLLILVVAAMVLRSRKKSKVRSVTGPVELPAPGQTGTLMAQTSANLDSQMESQLAERDALQIKMDNQALASLKLAPVITKKAEVFAKHLREKIASEPESAARALRSWIREEEQ